MADERSREPIPGSDPGDDLLPNNAAGRRLVTVRGDLRRGGPDEADERRIVDLAAVEWAPVTPADPVVAGTSTWQSFRSWMRRESSRRARERAANEAVATAMKVRAMQAAAPPVPADERTQLAMRGMLELNEERFQSLGFRSDKLHDELQGISLAIADLRGVVDAGASSTHAIEPANQALGELQERFAALLAGISSELARRTEESERRISEQLAAHSAEQAARLEDAVTRIRAAIPAEEVREHPRPARRPIPSSGSKFSELIVAVDRNTDRLSDAMHRGLGHLEQEITRRRPPR